MKNQQHTTENSVVVDRPVLGGSLIFLVGATALLLSFPERSLELMNDVNRFLTHDLGWLFLVFVFGGVCFLAWLGTSSYGDFRFREPDERPQYSSVSWFGMLFCAGIGSNLLYFGTTEWFGYYLSPPPLSGADPESLAAADWAGAYSFFHWGISAWGVYTLATLPIAFVLHCGKSRTLRVSTACRRIIPQTPGGDRLGQVIDILFIFGLVGGVGTSLGVGIPMLSAVASDLFGVDRGMMLDTWILVALTAMFSYSVSAGLDKGIKLLSDVNVGLAFLLLGGILLAGPTGFIVNQAMDSLAVMFQNFISMSLRMDAGRGELCSVQYSLFLGLVAGMGSVHGALYRANLSGTNHSANCVRLRLRGWSGLLDRIFDSGPYHHEYGSGGTYCIGRNPRSCPKRGAPIDAPQIVVELLQSMPFSLGVTIVFFILSFIFVATSLDSAAFTLASSASRNLPHDGQPPLASVDVGVRSCRNLPFLDVPRGTQNSANRFHSGWVSTALRHDGNDSLVLAGVERAEDGVRDSSLRPRSGFSGFLGPAFWRASLHREFPASVEPTWAESSRSRPRCGPPIAQGRTDRQWGIPRTHPVRSTSGSEPGITHP